MKVDAEDGRVYLPKEIRDRHGTEFELIDRGDKIILFPIPEDPLEALRQETGASMCFDTGHAFAEVGQEEMEKFLEEYSQVISHLYAQDTREGKDMHISIGEGEIDFEPVGGKLQDFNGSVTQEIYTDDPDYSRISRDKFLQHF